jgi:hypothetical protein
MDILPPARDDRGRFPPGISGNPSGRPAIDPGVRAAVHEIFQAASVEAAQRLVDLMRDEDARVATAAAVHVLDRLLGKVTQSIEAKVETENTARAHLRILQELQERRAAHMAAEAAKKTITHQEGEA